MFSEEIKLIWNQILSETQTLMDQELELAGFYYAYILNHRNFDSALSYMLSNKLGNEIVSALSIRDIINKIYHFNQSIVFSAVKDIQAAYNKDVDIECYSIPFLYFKGFHALQAYRISNYLWKNHRYELAIYFQNQISVIFSVDIHPATQIGNGIVLDHATGIVVGAVDIAKDNVVTVHQPILLDNIRSVYTKRCPIINDGVVIGVGAKILGPIEIGPRVNVSANSIVLTSIPSNNVVVKVSDK
ncbi:MAG: serine O-acetyltransferase [Buchnera aphidicola (Kaburagia rhusicola rhusicola)]